ncbi:MAG TPA: hypothetical protein VNO43_04670 [Candidatus Eisenbacteria bacterium]|nr:hypothetical protein [Candidatus Eisenbacteria bacterium]
MKNAAALAPVIVLATLLALSSCATQEDKAPAKPPAAEPRAQAKEPEKPAPEKAPAEKAEKPAEKAKAEKARGDVGLLDTDKNYLILVTKEGKLVTLDFDQKTKVTQIDPTPAKIGDIGLGSSATVTYTKQGDKNVATSVEYTPAKGGD